MTDHLNKYYFDDEFEEMKPSEKTINYVIVSHPDQDHVVGLKQIFENSYKTIAELEDIAIDKGVCICEAFQGGKNGRRIAYLFSVKGILS